MIRNRNGYWMSPSFYALFAPDNGGGTGGADGGATGTDGAGGANGGNDGNDGADGANGGNDGANDGNDPAEELRAEIERLKAANAKLKDANDELSSEAAKAKRAIKAKMTAEEIAAKEKEEADEKTRQELDELRRKVAKGETVKGVMGKLGLSEDAAGELSDCLYGAADIENALLCIQKAWQVKEKALRLEFGKITAPGAGGDSNSPEAQAILRAQEIGKKQAAVSEQAQKALSAYLR